MRPDWQTRDVLAWARDYQGPKFHALLCDPPYELDFMGKSWDRRGVAFDPETWAQLSAHLYPGAFGLAFASARGWHRLAAAIEDAGLILHHSLFCWAKGDGFPKATRIRSKAPEIDAQWAGHRYGRQALKPAVEPIVLFQKPFGPRPVDDITQHGAGALNIEGCRIPLTPHDQPGRVIQRAARERNGYGLNTRGRDAAPEYHPEGRWPSNLILDEATAAALDAQAGPRKSGRMKAGTQRRNTVGYRGAMPDRTVAATYGDSGAASRFFHVVSERLDAADPVYYCGKARRTEREAGLGLSAPRRDKLWSSGTQNPGSFQSAGTDRSSSNPHPTVKPIDLARHLATLLLPPPLAGDRRLLVPFAGVGSEVIGAALAGWDWITAIEQDPEYSRLAAQRLAHWLAVIEEMTDVAV